MIQVLLHRYPRRIIELWIENNLGSAHPINQLALEQQIRIRYCSAKQLMDLAGAPVKYVAHCHPIPIHAEHELLTSLAASQEACVLLLDRITDPQNLGAILRTAYGTGVKAVVIPKHHSVKLTDTVRRVSCGGADLIDIYVVTNLAQTIQHLKAAGFWIYGAAMTGDALVWQAAFRGKVGFVLGAEDKGLRPRTKALCDQLVHIPIADPIGSFNVSVATAMVLYEWQRQKANG